MDTSLESGIVSPLGKDPMDLDLAPSNSTPPNPTDSECIDILFLHLNDFLDRSRCFFIQGMGDVNVEMASDRGAEVELF